MYQFGLTLKFLREKYGYSQEEIATQLGVKASTIRRWENSTTFQPSTEKLLKVAKLFQISLTELLDLPVAQEIDISRLSTEQQKLMSLLIMEFKGIAKPK